MTWYLTMLQYRYLKENPNFEVKIWFFRYQKFNFCTICKTPTNQMTVFQVTPHQCRIHRPSDQVEKCWEHYGCDGPAQVGDEVTKEVGFSLDSTNETCGKENCFLNGFLWCFLSISSSSFFFPPVRLPSPSSAHVPGWRVFRGTSPQVPRFSKKSHIPLKRFHASHQACNPF